MYIVANIGDVQYCDRHSGKYNNHITCDGNIYIEWKQYCKEYYKEYIKPNIECSIVDLIESLQILILDLKRQYWIA